MTRDPPGGYVTRNWVRYSKNRPIFSAIHIKTAPGIAAITPPAHFDSDFFFDKKVDVTTGNTKYCI